MKNVIVELKERSYPIVVSYKMEEFTTYLENIGTNRHVVIVTDSNVANYHLEGLKMYFEGLGYHLFTYVIEAGEESKNLNTVSLIYSYLLQNKIEKINALIAFGGGVVGDITGFVAATYLRGVPFIQIPTTLLAQVDSSVGGKVGVNFLSLKNMIGAFYQPKAVLINPAFLKTLPMKHMKVGLAEIIVHCIIAEEAFFSYIEQHLEDIFSHKTDVLEYVISKNCSIKSSVVGLDERDTGRRAILNFGHTIGHAVESVSKFTLTHGEAVSIGIIGAFLISSRLGIVKEGESKRVHDLLDKIGLPTYLEYLEVEKVYEQMLHDKKARQDELFFILPIRIGEVKQVKVTNQDMILDVLTDLKSKKA